jgi:hypothetical protein
MADQMQTLIAFDRETALKNLCDVVFNIEGKNIYVHTFFLNSCPYFQTMLHSGMQETMQQLEQVRTVFTND